jgi:hypothetical protein
VERIAALRQIIVAGIGDIDDLGRWCVCTWALQ